MKRCNDESKKKQLSYWIMTTHALLLSDVLGKLHFYYPKSAVFAQLLVA